MSSAKLEEVPYIRSRKSLTIRFTKYAESKSVKEADADRKRAAFVINSEHLLQFPDTVRLDKLAAWPAGLLSRQLGV